MFLILSCTVLKGETLDMDAVTLLTSFGPESHSSDQEVDP